MKKQKTCCEGVVLLVFGGMICFFGGTPVPTFATPIIIPQTDWSRVDLEVWVSDNPASPWREVLERPIGSGYIVELYK